MILPLSSLFRWLPYALAPTPHWCHPLHAARATRPQGSVPGSSGTIERREVLLFGTGTQVRGRLLMADCG
ncbi:MAG: hypothetical protein WCC08_00035, partial [Terrimicrobiaceae bacterium]